MFSSRLPWNVGSNLFSKAVQQKRRSGIYLLNLIESNPTQVGLFDDLTAQEILCSFLDTRSMRYEPHPQGLQEARQAIATEYYQKRGIQVDPEHLILCASTSEAYSWLFQLLCNGGEQILFPQPSYPLFEHIAALSSVRMNPYILFYEDRFRLYAAALQEAYRPNTKAMVVVHPNNPTGSFLQKEELQTVFNFCRNHQLALIADEVFLDYPLCEDAYRAASLANEAAGQDTLCFVLSGFSKVLGLPQLKLGWIYVAGPEPLRSQAQERLELIADTFLSVNTPVQWAAKSLLQKQELLAGRIHKRLLNNLHKLKTLLQDTPCQLLNPEGGFSAIIRLPKILSEEEWVLQFLKEENVMVHPGYFYDFSTEVYIVVSLLPKPEIFEEGIQRILNRTTES